MTRAGEPVDGRGKLILITDGWLANAGDAASYLATSAALEEAAPGVRVVFASHHRDLVGSLYPELELAPPLDSLAGVRWPWTTEADLAEAEVIERLVERADLALVPGGGNMIERYKPAGRISTYEVLLERGKRLAFFSQSIGRFRDRELGKRLERVLEAAELVLVRDEASLRIAREQLGDSDRLRLTADQAFLFKGERRLQRPRSVLVAASAHPWDRDSGESELEEVGLVALGESLSRLLRSEAVHTITLASTAQGLGPAGVALEDDLLAAERVREAVPPNFRNRIKIRRGYIDPSAFAGLAAAHSATVSMRMHGAILAAIAGAPVLLANASDKARSLSARTDGRLAAIDSAADLGRIDELLSPMLTERSRVLPRQNEATEELRALARTNAPLVAELIR